MTRVMDLLASQVKRSAHLLEKAVFDAGPWTIRCAGVEAPAERVIEIGRVVFLAAFPAGTEAGLAALCCAGVEEAVRQVDVPPAAIEWVLRPGRTEPVAA
jgi:hypothetical protein